MTGGTKAKAVSPQRHRAHRGKTERQRLKDSFTAEDAEGRRGKTERQRDKARSVPCLWGVRPSGTIRAFCLWVVRPSGTIFAFCLWVVRPSRTIFAFCLWVLRPSRTIPASCLWVLRPSGTIPAEATAADTRQLESGVPPAPKGHKSPSPGRSPGATPPSPQALKGRDTPAIYRPFRARRAPTPHRTRGVAPGSGSFPPLGRRPRPLRQAVMAGGSAWPRRAEAMTPGPGCHHLRSFFRSFLPSPFRAVRRNIRDSAPPKRSRAPSKRESAPPQRSRAPYRAQERTTKARKRTTTARWRTTEARKRTTTARWTPDISRRCRAVLLRHQKMLFLW